MCLQFCWVYHLVWLSVCLLTPLPCPCWWQGKEGTAFPESTLEEGSLTSWTADELFYHGLRGLGFASSGFHSVDLSSGLEETGPFIEWTPQDTSTVPSFPSSCVLAEPRSEGAECSSSGLQTRPWSTSRDEGAAEWSQ